MKKDIEIKKQDIPEYLWCEINEKDKDSTELNTRFNHDYNDH